MKALAVTLALFLLPGVVEAQKLDCRNPITQADLNQCTYQDWQVADAALNASYADAVSMARQMDSYGGIGAEEGLRAAQRAWVAFRDLACETEGKLAEGGSMQPMLVSGCMLRLTVLRTDDLLYFAGIND